MESDVILCVLNCKTAVGDLAKKLCDGTCEVEAKYIVHADAANEDMFNDIDVKGRRYFRWLISKKRTEVIQCKFEYLHFDNRNDELHSWTRRP